MHGEKIHAYGMHKLEQFNLRSLPFSCVYKQLLIQKTQPEN